jgi:hypothetical protein
LGSRLRAALKQLDVDSNGKVCFIEFLLFKYKKSLQQLFEEKPGNFAALIAALEEAIQLFEEVEAKKAEEMETIASLQVIADAGG